jgi:membrane protein
MAVVSRCRNVVEIARENELTLMAAGIALYTLLSLVPLLLLAVSLASLVGGDEFVEALIRNRLASRLSSSGQELLVRALTGLERQATAGIIGLLAALWSVSKVFRGLERAFSELYRRAVDQTILKRLLDALVVMGLLVLAAAAMVAVAAAISFATLPVPYPTLVGAIVLLVALFVVLLPIYYVLTPMAVTVREIVPGTVVAVVGFVVLQVGFYYYAQSAGQYKALGIVGAVFLFVTWLYFGSIVLLVGGAVNCEAGRSS